MGFTLGETRLFLDGLVNDARVGAALEETCASKNSGTRGEYAPRPTVEIASRSPARLPLPYASVSSD
jgi:hypothetical protein